MLKQIIRATCILGSASFVTLLFASVRFKFIAVQYGQRGMGVVGILYALYVMGMNVLSFGVANTGVNFVAKKRGQGEEALYQLGKALSSLSLCLSLIVIALSFSLAKLLAPIILGGDGYTKIVCGAMIAIGLQVSVMIQQGYFYGVGRYSLAAKINIASACMGTLVAVPIIYYSKYYSSLAVIICVPFFGFFLTRYWFGRLQAQYAQANATENTDAQVFKNPFHKIVAYLFSGVQKHTISFRSGYMVRIKNDLKGKITVLLPLLHLGVVFTASFGFVTLCQFSLRLYIKHALSIEAVGVFQAAWNVGGSYLTFFLTALIGDYYARVSAASEKPGKLCRIVSDQMRAALLLCVPVILLMMTYSPLGVYILYSSKFSASAAILRNMMFGDVFCILNWCLMFMLLARCVKLKYFISQAVTALLFLGGGCFFLKDWGVMALGPIYSVSSALGFLLTLAIAFSEIRFKVSWDIALYIILSLLALFLIHLSAQYFGNFYTYGVGTVFCLIFGIIAVFYIRRDVPNIPQEAT